MNGAKTLAAAALAVPLTLVLPAAPAVAARSLCGPPPDTVSPLATGVTLSTDSVDLNSGSRDITITVHASDTSGNGTPSGVRRVDAYLSGPRVGLSKQLKLSGGTTADGEWSGTVTVPKTSHPGTLSLEEVDVTDAAGNSRQYRNGGTYAQSPTDILLQSTWDTSVTITGTPLTISYKNPGKLAGFSFTPQAVDTRAKPKKVHVFANFHRPFPTRVELSFQRTSGHGRGVQGKRVFKPVSAGHWAGYVKVRRWLGNSTNKPRLFVEYGHKVKPRFHEYSPTQLKKLGSPAKLSVTSGVDKVRPVLTGLTVSPSSVDTTGGPETVTLTAKATDNSSGVKRVGAFLNIGQGQVDAASAPAGGLYPYTGLGFEQSGFKTVNLKLAGGTWTGTAVFRECESIGNWRVNVNVQDVAGNYKSYPSRHLIRAGLPGILPVTSTPGDIQAPDAHGATASSLNKQVTIDFSEGVKNVSATTLSLYAVRPAAARYKTAATLGGMTCSNGVAIIDCSGTTNDGLVTSVVIDLPALTPGADYVVYANVDPAAPQLTDGIGNPMDSNYEIADVTGS